MVYLKFKYDWKIKKTRKYVEKLVSTVSGYGGTKGQNVYYVMVW